MIFQKLKDRIRDWWRGTSPLLGGAGRSSKWPKVRAEFLRVHPNCEVCGGKGTFLKPLNIHHIIPVSFDIARKYELDYTNLITLCRDDHLTFGHLKKFSSQNPDILEDVKIWQMKILNRP